MKTRRVRQKEVSRHIKSDQNKLFAKTADVFRWHRHAMDYTLSGHLPIRSYNNEAESGFELFIKWGGLHCIKTDCWIHFLVYFFKP